MLYLTSLVMLIIGFATQEMAIITAAGLFAIAGAIEIHK